MSQHNIVGSEAFDTERHVRIRAYPKRARNLRGYAIAAVFGVVLAFAIAGAVAWLHGMAGS